MIVQPVETLGDPVLKTKLDFAGLDNWSNFVNAVYGYKAYRRVVFENDALIGALHLVEIRHPIFGHYLTTAPYGSYGGFTSETEEAGKMLFQEASQLSSMLGVQYTVIRAVDRAIVSPETWIPHHIYSTYLINLPSDPDDLFKTFSPDHRNHVRKSLRKGMSLRFGRTEILEDVYKALSASMHELGSPYHSKAYLRTMAEYLGDSLEFAVVYDPDGDIAGSGVFIYHGNTVSNLHANILRGKRRLYAGEFLYWSVIERGISKGLKTFDLGRSLVGSGNETFKLKWSPYRQPLAYWYWLAPGQRLPELNQKNRKLQVMIAIWKRLPASIVNFLGPYLIRGIA